MVRVEPLTSLTPDQRAAVLALVDAATAADGVAPLNEEARLQLGRTDALHWLATDGDAIVGYAQWQPTNATGQLVVHPEHRRAGHGTSLFAALTSDVAEPAIWAFGDQHGAQRFAASADLVPARGLHIMERDLQPGEGGRRPPEGVRLRSFTPDDADAFLAVNAAAFADHPEQGHFSADDLANRQAEPWWNPGGLILAEDAEGVVGFHWTKRHDDTTGEVYVLGVHPRGAGRGLGGVLLDAGLAYLARGGNTRVILYVDAGNTPAVALYERSGFRVVHTDTLYRPTTGSA